MYIKYICDIIGVERTDVLFRLVWRDSQKRPVSRQVCVSCPH